MSVARTYFFNRMAGDELARLCDAKADFFLENVDDLELAVTRLQALCRDAGMSSAVNTSISVVFSDSARVPTIR